MCSRARHTAVSSALGTVWGPSLGKPWSPVGARVLNHKGRFGARAPLRAAEFPSSSPSLGQSLPSYLTVCNNKLNNKHNTHNNKQHTHNNKHSKQNKHNNTWFSTPKKARNPGHANHVLKTPLCSLCGPSFLAACSLWEHSFWCRHSVA